MAKRRPRIIRHPQPANPLLFELPGVAIRVAQALAVLRPGSAPRTCGHRPLFSVWTLCAHHPTDGLMCERCGLRHVEDHSWMAEHGCDACDTVPPDLILKPLATIVETATETVVIQGLGVCRRCRGVEAA